VAAGAGLTGGGSSGNLTLNVNFSGSGTASTVARVDHTHERGTSDNTAVGAGAMPGTSGDNNAAFGRDALNALTSGAHDTAVGALSLDSLTSGFSNTAIGFNAGSALTTDSTNTGAGALALDRNSVGASNVAVGYAALRPSTGSGNSALGFGTLDDLAAGDFNLALGFAAGNTLTTGSYTVYVGASSGAATENNTMRFGGFNQVRTFIAGIRGVATANNDALAVVVDSAGQLGTLSSSAKTKFDIQDLPHSSARALHQLRPVSFRYRQPFADGSTPVQFGLIAEEVQRVLPELVALDGQGEPASVKYHVLP